jgi:hypothetical protein
MYMTQSKEYKCTEQASIAEVIDALNGSNEMFSKAVEDLQTTLTLFLLPAAESQEEQSSDPAASPVVEYKTPMCVLLSQWLQEFKVNVGILLSLTDRINLRNYDKDPEIMDPFSSDKNVSICVTGMCEIIGSAIEYTRDILSFLADQLDMILPEDIDLPEFPELDTPPENRMELSDKLHRIVTAVSILTASVNILRNNINLTP